MGGSVNGIAICGCTCPTAAEAATAGPVAGSVAVWRTGFWTCVLLTLCMMMGECVLVCRADHACMEDEARDEEEIMLEAGEGDGPTTVEPEGAGDGAAAA